MLPSCSCSMTASGQVFCPQLHTKPCAYQFMNELGLIFSGQMSNCYYNQDRSAPPRNAQARLKPSTLHCTGFLRHLNRGGQSLNRLCVLWAVLLLALWVLPVPIAQFLYKSACCGLLVQRPATGVKHALNLNTSEKPVWGLLSSLEHNMIIIDHWSIRLRAVFRWRLEQHLLNFTIAQDLPGVVYNLGFTLEAPGVAQQHKLCFG